MFGGHSEDSVGVDSFVVEGYGAFIKTESSNITVTIKNQLSFYVILVRKI